MLLTGDRNTYASPGTLARVPAIGGTPRPLVEGATHGDWAPDGEQLAVIRERGRRCEFPIGRPIASECGTIRVSPTGDLVAIVGSNGLEILDLTGRRVASDDLGAVFGLAWSPDGRELWFTGSETDSAHDRALYALSIGGTRRLIARIAGAMSVYDVAPDGKSALIGSGAGWWGINASSTDGDKEQVLDLLGRSAIAGLSADGKWMLADETREVGKGEYLRSTDGASTVLLKQDRARGLSPDGAWVLLHPRGDLSRLELLPTGAGESRAVPLNPGLELSAADIALWSRDGRRLFMWLQPKGEGAGARLYVREGEQPWQAVTPPTAPGPFAVSPDGGVVAVRAQDGFVTLFSIDGRPPRRLEGERGEPIHWSADGLQLFLAGPEQFPARIYRRNLITGAVDPWRTISPADPSGVMFTGRVFIADDDKFYVYQYARGLNDLYLVSGMR